MSVTVGATTAQTPSQANFGSLKGSVAAYVQGQNLPSVLSDSGIAVNAAIDHLNTRNWHWLGRQGTITLTADTRTYSVPANFKRPRKFSKLDTNSKTVGRYDYLIPKVFLDCDFDNTASGSPTVYTVRNASDDRLLTFDVPPSTAFATSWPTGTLSYFARMQHFADDGDTIGDLLAPPDVRNFLLWYARWEMAGIRGTATQVQEADRAWNRAWVALMKDDTNEQTDWSI